MDLILWRHADAEDASPDLARALTPKGHKQATQMARWLREHLPEDTRIVVSPARRAQETAQALVSDFETVEAVAPGATHEAVLSAAHWPQARRAVLVVGHQPTLGQVVAVLISGTPSEWLIKKGGICWITRRVRGGQAQVLLRAVMSPDLL
jgi:phosphohistidine phosphatase